jgi:hypothetical protein
MILAVDSGVVVAVALVQQSAPKSPIFFLKFVAVAATERRTGRHLGDLIFERVLNWCAARTTILAETELILAAKIHPANSSSEKWAQRNGFRMVRSDIPLRLWELIAEL